MHDQSSRSRAIVLARSAAKSLRSSLRRQLLLVLFDARSMSNAEIEEVVALLQLEIPSMTMCFAQTMCLRQPGDGQLAQLQTSKLLQLQRA